MDLRFVKVETDEQLRLLAELANGIWHEYFPGIISLEQVDYMVEKFQSYEAIGQQLKDGYEYYLFYVDEKAADQSDTTRGAGEPVGYTGIHPENGKLFLSKLYLKKEFRGLGLASQAFVFLEKYCVEHDLSAIWLTVNRFNDHTVQVYEKKGFVTVRMQAADIGNGFVMDDYIMEKTISEMQI